VEDNNVEKPPPPVVRFISVWKAFNRTEVLPRCHGVSISDDNM